VIGSLADEIALKRQAWAAADLRYLLYPLQLEWKVKHETCGERWGVLECSRRIGKTVYALVKCFETGIRIPKGHVRYAAPTSKLVEEIINPTIEEIFLPECPKEFRPAWKDTKKLWRFPNGFELHVAGVNNGHEDDLRGPWANGVLIDEAGYVDKLKYVKNSVLGPQLLTTKGWGLVLSSPAESPAHDFTDVCVEAEKLGSYVHATIYDALAGGHPSIDERTVEEFARDVGGKETTDWKREYEAKRVVDEKSAIIPEFTDLEAKLVEDFETRGLFPEHFKAYVIGDNGFTDLAFWLFVVHDFKRDLLLFQDEMVFEHKTSSDMRIPLRAKEIELWGSREPEFRLCDATEQALAEFVRHDGLNPDGTPTEPYPVGRCPNDDLDATVNALRVATKRLKYRVHPRCRLLRLHMRNGVWNDARTKFKRTPGYGHFDGIAAAMYSERVIPRDVNPYPSLPEGANYVDWHLPVPQPQLDLRGIGSRWRK
jgi:hypothetical protein